METQQYVCTTCGFNMIGYYPAQCPFCGAPKGKFITSEQCSKRFRVEGTRVRDGVTRLNSVPSLGFEHAAYRIESGKGILWIDCPSAFDRRVEQADLLMFTHHHFLGASNLYRELFSAKVWIHRLDSAHDLCSAFTFDETFESDFEEMGVEALHIGGHTPGFTMYIFDDILFICDYVFLQDDGMTLNPYGPLDETIAGSKRIKEALEGRSISKVCGYNYVVEYSEWKRKFGQRPVSVGH